MKLLKLLPLLAILCCLTGIYSCVSKKDLIYFQNKNSTIEHSTGNNESKIRDNDILSVNIEVHNYQIPELKHVYNKEIISSKKHLVKDGKINIPELDVLIKNIEKIDPHNLPVSKDDKITYDLYKKKLIEFQNQNNQINIVGKTSKEAAELINNMIEKSLYLLYSDFGKKQTYKSSTDIKIDNFIVNVLGEVRKPGQYLTTKDKFSIIDAIALANDLTPAGNRTNIKIIRKNETSNETILIDITDKNIINSPNYYLQQNDIVYVETNKISLQQNKTNIPIILSICTLLIMLLK